MERAFNVPWESFATAVLVKEVFEASREIWLFPVIQQQVADMGKPIVYQYE
jgi:hypothetical protein